jgi:hypothetical protein
LLPSPLVPTGDSNVDGEYFLAYPAPILILFYLPEEFCQISY